MSTLQFSVRLRNAMLAALPTILPAGTVIKIYSGTMPDNAGAADQGTVLATITTTEDWLLEPASGTISMTGLLEDPEADADGTAAFFRAYAPDAACDIQGTVSLTGGGGAMTVDNVLFKQGQKFDITAFAITAGNR
jgi:hypothetical protein